MRPLKKSNKTCTTQNLPDCCVPAGDHQLRAASKKLSRLGSPMGVGKECKAPGMWGHRGNPGLGIPAGCGEVLGFSPSPGTQLVEESRDEYPGMIHTRSGQSITRVESERGIYGLSMNEK